jgi:hypothetical protein
MEKCFMCEQKTVGRNNVVNISKMLVKNVGNISLKFWAENIAKISKMLEGKMLSPFVKNVGRKKLSTLLE